MSLLERLCKVDALHFIKLPLDHDFLQYEYQFLPDGKPQGQPYMGLGVSDLSDHRIWIVAGWCLERMQERLNQLPPSSPRNKAQEKEARLLLQILVGDDDDTESARLAFATPESIIEAYCSWKEAAPAEGRCGGTPGTAGK